MAEQEGQQIVPETTSPENQSVDELKRNLAKITEGVTNLRRTLFQAGTEARLDADEFDPDSPPKP